MKYTSRRKLNFIVAFLMVLFTSQSGMCFTEPVISDYTAYPLFANETVAPNVMIILDNSGSMKSEAYSSSSYEGEPFAGSPAFRVAADADDTQEYNTGYMDWNSSDLDIGENTVGLRFQNVDIAQGVQIKAAYIEFIAKETDSDAISLTIAGEAVENADPFGAEDFSISNRTAPLTAAVNWSPGTWSSGQTYATSDVSAIVQEIVNLSGWTANNAMAFRISAPGSANQKRVSYCRNSGAVYAPVLRVVYGNTAAKKYYGYFNPEYFYKYSNSRFEPVYKKIEYNYTADNWNVENLTGVSATVNSSAIVSQKLWDGNWMNWMTMLRVDVVRKVLIGGDTRSTSASGSGNKRDGSGKQVIYAHDNSFENRVFNSSAAIAVTPYHGNYSYRLDDGLLRIYDYSSGWVNTVYKVRVLKDYDIEPESFHEYDTGVNVAGVLQRLGNTARWGNIWFTYNDGGYVENAMGVDMVELVYDLERQDPSTWTPLAETFYVAMQYFKQENPQSGLSYAANAIASDGNENKLDADDPFYRGGEEVPCAKSFVILLTDGQSTYDTRVPAEYKDVDGDGDDQTCNEGNSSTKADCDYGSYGTDFLDDIALYAHTNDLRPNLEGNQTITLYTIYAFGDSQEAKQLLMDAARNGGFKDSEDNPNGLPDGGYTDSADNRTEWDKDGDGVPDNYFDAADGFALEASLTKTIAQISKSTASGSSASVMAATNEGEAGMVQAYFRSSVSAASEDKEAAWLGFMHSLWVDADGVLRNDGGSTKGTLDDHDKKVVFTTDDEGNTKVLIEGDSTEYNVDDIDVLQPIFEVGNQMASTGFDPGNRKIFTFIDKNKDGAIDDSGTDMFDSTGEIISFDTKSVSNLLPYLGVSGDTAWADSGAGLGDTVDERAQNIITWVRGTDVDGLRNRTLDGKTYRLGDIMQSTPVTVDKASDSYHIIYSDESYLEYYNSVAARESVVYVGANDGMLHAFTSGFFNVDKDGAKSYIKPSGNELGDEIWAFIPQAVLPHLKWTAQENYTHTYLVDGKPRIFDAQVNGQWGTFLVMGLNMGARQIQVYEDFGSGKQERDFYPSYFCIDITQPRSPKLLWERTYPNLNMSRSRPAPVKVGDSWFVVFGSGPTEYDGASSKPGYLYVADLATGELKKQFGPLDSNAYFNDPVSFDKNLNYNVDAIFAGSAYYENNTWKGSIYKLAVPCGNCQWASDYDASQEYGYDEDPANWLESKLFDSPDAPITAPVSVSIESFPDKGIDNVWIYFGTGRYIGEDDMYDGQQQYIYGIKDPFFNANSINEIYQHDFANFKTVERDTLIYGNDFTVTTYGSVVKDGNLYSGDFLAFEEDIQKNYDGWYRALDTSGSNASERIISKPSLLGGMVFVPAYTPSDEVCLRLGHSNFYAIYYVTGTGYTDQIFNISNPDTIDVEGKIEEIVAVKLQDSYIGMPPSGVGFHVGNKKGATAFPQLSTGQILELEVDTPFYLRSSLIDWWNDMQHN
ncbi:MAG: hypothetical protein GY874_18655 [Desulfobacteraceae bacterium]|nr:hypothetical protein [Desulfobacteraceae bacterium]